jgi:hypothetical protein
VHLAAIEKRIKTRRAAWRGSKNVKKKARGSERERGAARGSEKQENRSNAME